MMVRDRYTIIYLNTHFYECYYNLISYTLATTYLANCHESRIFPFCFINTLKYNVIE